VEPSDWVSVAALGVALVSILVSGFVAPRIGARIEREHRIGTARSEVYADTIRLLRARQRDINEASFGYPALEDEPALEVEPTMARLLLYANEPVWRGVEEFFRLYRAASPGRMAAESDRSQGLDDTRSRLEIAHVGYRMSKVQDAIIDHMRGDIGTRGLFLAVGDDREPKPPPDAERAATPAE
jgi:hypothetical protein